MFSMVDGIPEDDAGDKQLESAPAPVDRLPSTIAKLASDPHAVLQLAYEYEGVVFDALEQRGAHLEKLAELTEILVTWCDHHPELRADPTPLTLFYRHAFSFEPPDDDFDLPRPRAPTLEVFSEAAFDALDLVWRVRLAAHVQGGLPELHDTAKRVGDAITKRPGMIGKEVAAAAETSAANVYTIFRLHLRPRGFKRVGQGYFAPGGSELPPEEDRRV